MFFSARHVRAPPVPLAHATRIENHTWIEAPKPKDYWSPRFTSVVVPGSSSGAYLLGGWNETTPFNDVWRYLSGWKQVAVKTHFPGRFGFASGATTSGDMVIAGGLTTQGVYLNDTWTSTDGVVWAHAGNGPWTARAGLSTVHIGALFLLGGCDDSACPTDVWSFVGGTWSFVTPQAPWKGRRFAAVSQVSASIVLVGGVSAANTVLSDVWRSSDGAEWAELKPIIGGSSKFPTRAGACMLSFRGVTWLMGGFQSTSALPSHSNTSPSRPRITSGASAVPSTPLADVWQTTDGEHWWQVSPASPWRPRYGMGCAGYDGKLFVLGGGFPSTSSTSSTASTSPRRLASPPTSTINDFWASTVNILCELGGTVCDGHGNCTGASLSASEASSAPLPVAKRRFTLDPFSVPYPAGGKCSCERGYGGDSCSTLTCNSANCKHGKCVTPTGEPGTPCHCDDGWQGVSCDAPVCSGNCNSHGTCIAPNHCHCTSHWAGPSCSSCSGEWSGRDCSISLPKDLVARVGRWVHQHSDAVFVVGSSASGLLVLFAAAVMNCWSRRPSLAIDSGSKRGGHKSVVGGEPRPSPPKRVRFASKPVIIVESPVTGPRSFASEEDFDRSTSSVIQSPSASFLTVSPSPMTTAQSPGIQPSPSMGSRLPRSRWGSE